MLRSSFILLLAILLPATAFALPKIGETAPDFSATAIDGATVKLSDLKGSVVVLEWNNPDCPFVKKHYGTGNMQKLQSYARSKNVVWLTVNSSAASKEGSMTPLQAITYVHDNQMTVSHYLLDPEGVIGKLYGARATPHMFVIDSYGAVAYMGAIDDQPTTEAASVEHATNYVRLAIDSLLAGQPVATASTQAYGCSVKYAN